MERAIISAVRTTPLVRECVTYAGTKVSFSTVGDGPPVLVLPGWACHVTLDWSNDRLGTFYRILAQRRRVVFLDPPGADQLATGFDVVHRLNATCPPLAVTDLGREWHMNVMLEFTNEMYWGDATALEHPHWAMNTPMVDLFAGQGTDWLG